MQPQLLKMLDLQDAMNSKVTADWRSQGYAWYRAIWVECAELMDHYGWKWWKHQTPDMEQVILELVDIWHFGLSDLLQKSTQVDALAGTLSEALQEEPKDIQPFRNELENFVELVLTKRSFDVPAFCRVMAAAGLSFEQLYCQYMGKNVLNFFRQDNGYKEGHYKKHWQGKEDNEHLVEVLADSNVNSDTFQTDVYNALQVRYQQA